VSEIWQALIDLQDELIFRFQEHGTEINEPGMEKFNQPGWINRVWTSQVFRRAHVDVVDARDTKGLWMMHVCVFPHTNNAGPIYGLDVIAGKNKVTGFFHDFSPTVDHNNSLLQEFGDYVSQFNWKKERELPDWAKAIFSEHMIAVGNVNTVEELETLCEIGLQNCDLWLDTIDHSARCFVDDGKTAQNRYAHFQKQNPHTPRTMTALGLNEDDVKLFVQDCLFPDIK
jgi:hypothetical protein